MDAPRPVIVKSFVTTEPPAAALAYLSDLKNWEDGGALANVQPASDGWWRADTPLGPARIRLRIDRRARTFDHDFVGGGGAWTVFGRVTPNGRGSTVAWLFVCPVGMTPAEFASQLGRRFEREMDGLRRGLESRSSPARPAPSRARGKGPAAPRRRPAGVRRRPSGAATGNSGGGSR